MIEISYIKIVFKLNFTYELLDELILAAPLKLEVDIDIYRRY